MDLALNNQHMTYQPKVHIQLCYKKNYTYKKTELIELELFDSIRTE